MDSQTLSLNFSVAKVLAIITVVSSHWFTDIPLWAAATIALFIFGFSSAFFTGRIYGTQVDVFDFWKKKLQRLGIRYWFILGVLAVLLTVQGQEVFHWHALVHVVGGSGILNLFGRSVSELGRGLWFFTLLLLFYTLYPLVAKLLVSQKMTTVCLFFVVICLLAINEQVHLGFSLWLTILGFIIGIYVGVNRFVLLKAPIKTAIALSFLAFGVLNTFFAYKGLNNVLFFVLSTATALWLTIATCPNFQLVRVLAKLEKCLLEIYLIHSYFFIHLTGVSVVDFAISLALIIAAALALNSAGSWLVTWTFDAKPSEVFVIDIGPTEQVAGIEQR